MTPALPPHLSTHDGPDHIRVTKGGWKDGRNLNYGNGSEKNRKRRQHAHEQHQEIAKRYEAGATMPAIAAELGISLHLVREVLIESDVDIKKGVRKP